MKIFNALELTSSNPRAIAEFEGEESEDKILAIIIDPITNTRRTATFYFVKGSADATNTAVMPMTIRTSSGSGVWKEAVPRVPEYIPAVEPIEQIYTISLTAISSPTFLSGFSGVIKSLTMSQNLPLSGSPIISFGTSADPTAFITNLNPTTITDDLRNPHIFLFNKKITNEDIIFKVTTIGLGSLDLILSAAKIS